MCKTKIFINKIILKNNPNHFNKDGSLRYVYDKTNYIKSDIKVIITCKEHGDFEQVPNSHLKGKGCMACKLENNTNKKDIGYFIDKANKVHNDRYIYIKTCYVLSKKEVVITCPEHGDFNVVAANHLQGQGCPSCSKGSGGYKSYDITTYIAKANNVHGKKYTYTKTDFIKSTLKVVITCPEHGDFTQKASNHLKGQGCPSCGVLNKGYTKTYFKNRCIKNNKGLGILYIIRCFNHKESFYKVGITSNSIESRFKSRMPYKYEVIHEVHREPIKVYDMEKELLRSLAYNKYQPLITFAGQTECFTDLEALYKLFKQKLAA